MGTTDNGKHKNLPIIDWPIIGQYYMTKVYTLA